jgi:hypothetical protein
MTTKQFLIDSLSDTFARRCDYFIAQDDIETTAAIYSEWVVDGVDPENGEYEWCFIPNLTVNK